MSDQTRRLSRRLEAIPKRVRAAVQPELIKAGTDLMVTMRTLAPEDSGDLKKSIRLTAPGETTPPYSMPGGSRTAADNQVLVTAGDTDVRYAHLQEYGTVNSPAHPFFWPAYRLKKKRLATRIKSAIRKAIKGAAK